LPEPALATAGHSRGLTARNALLIYAVLFFALIHPFWLFGELVVPYRLASEIGAPPASASTALENNKFSDYWHGFIPEIREHLQAPRSGWLALWTNQNELGRPLFHTSGFSPAYAPTWLISKITDDPYVLLTLLSLGSCFLAGLFVLLLCKELSLRPIAGLLAGASVAASPLMMYWLTFTVFLSVTCWSAGLLYALTRLARKLDSAGCAVLAFSSYSLLMTAYPQAVVFQAYILTGYLAWLGYRRWRSMGVAAAIRYLAVVAAAGVSGMLLVLPVFLDLAETAAQSARVSPDVSFFLAALYNIDSIATVMRVFALGTFPELAGNPISPSYPLPYYGLSVTPLVMFFAFFSLSRCWRQTWGWWLAIAVLCAFATIHPLYAFGVRYMGFNLSRSSPMGTILLPLAIICAYGVNALVGHSPFKAAAARFALFGTLACLAIAVCFYWTSGLSIRWDAVLATLVVVGLLAQRSNSFRTACLVAALIITGATISFPLMLRQPPANLIATSPLLDKVKAATTSDSRFAMAAPGLDVLLPNMNGIFDVASIHSYDSLSSRRYQALIGELGGETKIYGRWNGAISPDYDGRIFWMSNISLMMSPAALSHPNLENIGDQGPLHFYRVIDRMGCCVQTALPDRTGPDGIELTGQKAAQTHRPSKTRDEGDLLEFAVEDRQDSVLVLSRQYHPRWQASVRTASGWSAARTVPVNGVFQGVVLPAGTQTVRLQFVPFVRFAWIAHVVWALVLLILAAQAMRMRLVDPRI
jgi:hypothetical protein